MLEKIKLRTPLKQTCRQTTLENCDAQWRRW